MLKIEAYFLIKHTLFFYALVLFPQPGARLPVRYEVVMMWGKREKEAIGKFPNEDWVRLSSIQIDEVV